MLLCNVANTEDATPLCTGHLSSSSIDQRDRLHKALMLVPLCAMLVWLSGCSVFVTTPKTTRVEVTGLNNQVNEYIIVTDEPDESDLDIKLTDRYALRLDFQWLWNDHISPFVLDSGHMSDPSDEQLIPWITCKYNF